jgi:hypothetical protein
MLLMDKRRVGMPPDDEPRYFIDTHCHFFSIEHVPLRQTIKRISFNFNRSMITRGLLAAGMLHVASFFGPLLALGSNAIARKLYRKFERFIRFFDQGAKDNIHQTIRSLTHLGSLGGLDRRQRIFTPLIMDFERCESYKDLSGQVADLRQALHHNRAYMRRKQVRVLPFLGIDLRRFHQEGAGQAMATLDALLSIHVGTLKSPHERRDIGQLENGDFIGIKLYPSLGFDLYPESTGELDSNIAALEAMQARDLPITVHCQKDSFECSDRVEEQSNEMLINFAHPNKWLRLFEENPQLHGLRLNLAHFGGEDGVADLLVWDEDWMGGDNLNLRPSRVSRESWTHGIIRMIKTYPNVYADLSAFDFQNEKAVVNLWWLLAWDLGGQLNIDGDYRVIDKLMWGSDLPMVLSGYDDYRELFEDFYRCLDMANLDAGDYALPGQNLAQLPSRDQLYNQLVEQNPRRFLFPGS